MRFPRRRAELTSTGSIDIGGGLPTLPRAPSCIAWLGDGKWGYVIDLGFATVIRGVGTAQVGMVNFRLKVNSTSDSQGRERAPGPYSEMGSLSHVYDFDWIIVGMGIRVGVSSDTSPDYQFRAWNRSCLYCR